MHIYKLITLLFFNRIGYFVLNYFTIFQIQIKFIIFPQKLVNLCILKMNQSNIKSIIK